MQSDAHLAAPAVAPYQPRLPGRVPTSFHVDCAVCGRQLRVLVAHLGREVVCEHCGFQFTASAPESHTDGARSALSRAEQLLSRCSSMNIL